MSEKPSTSSVRVRFAPSPTGYLHVGGARTALYCYLYAQKHQGVFVLRIEDTDEERSTVESIQRQTEDLLWLGLKWDEGFDVRSDSHAGSHGPYRQSQRKEIYQEYANKLLLSGHAYYCFLTDEEIDLQKAAAEEKSGQFHVASPYRDGSIEDAKKKLATGASAVVRYKVPQEHKKYILKDLVRGQVEFSTEVLGDFVLLRSSGMPVYNFCCVIDDALMKISHVLRAEDHLNNTLRQLLIYEALAFSLPQFGHLSLILGEDKQKLSKRHGAASVHDFKQRGFLPEALKNFIALLGWSSPKGEEILSEADLIEQFSLDRLVSSPAVFGDDKLKWVNATHLRGLNNSELWARLEPFFTAASLSLPDDVTWQGRALDLFKPKMELLADAVELFAPLSQQPMSVSPAGQEVMAWEASRKVVTSWKNILADHSSEYLSEVEFSEIQEEVKKQTGTKGKFLFQPIRVAVIGHPQGADLKTLVPLLKRTALVEKAAMALD